MVDVDECKHGSDADDSSGLARQMSLEFYQIFFSRLRVTALAVLPYDDKSPSSTTRCSSLSLDAGMDNDGLQTGACKAHPSYQ